MLDAERIRMGRLKMRLSQKRLGELVGQDQAYISRVERGTITDITVRTLERFANVLQVSTDFLLAREDAKPPPSTANRPEDGHDVEPTHQTRRGKKGTPRGEASRKDRGEERTHP
jgi:transcriptional regulator with XRE-family HTH domain